MIAQTIQIIPEIPNVAAATPCTTRDLPASVKNINRRFITHIRVSYFILNASFETGSNVLMLFFNSEYDSYLTFDRNVL